MVSFAEWEKLDIRVATIKAVTQHPNADKLYVLRVDLGEQEDERELVAGVREHYTEDELLGKKIVMIANLEPREVRGVMSEGMILAADDGTNPIALLSIDRDVDNGAKVK